VEEADLRAFVDDLPPETRDLVLALRAVIRQTVPEAEESLLWGCLTYHRPGVGGRVKGAVCLISVKGGRVRLEFIHGVRLADPRGLLEGNRLSKRHIPIRAVADAERPEVAVLIGEAATLDPEDWE
jgi:hypothetical protein